MWCRKRDGKSHSSNTNYGFQRKTYHVWSGKSVKASWKRFYLKRVLSGQANNPWRCGKAYTTEGTARSMGQMGCVWGVFSCQVDSESCGKQLEIRRKNENPQQNKTNTNETEVVSNRLARWKNRQMRAANRGKMCRSRQLTGCRWRRGKSQGWSWRFKLDAGDFGWNRGQENGLV